MKKAKVKLPIIGEVPVLIMKNMITIIFSNYQVFIYARSQFSKDPNIQVVDVDKKIRAITFIPKDIVEKYKDKNYEELEEIILNEFLNKFKALGMGDVEIEK